MKRFILKLFIITFLATSAHAYDFCASLDGVKDEATYKTKIKKLISKQYKALANADNRYKVARVLNNCTPHKNSEGLFLAFAGTGAFNPRAFDIMAKAIKCKHVRGLPSWLQKKTYALVLSSLSAKGSSYRKWSAIEKGPMTRMIMSSTLKSRIAMYNFAIYPSEESEAIADYEKMGWAELKNIPSEMKKSYKGNPTGIKNALNCTKIYLEGMSKKGKTPKIILMSHSSGGRSVVKFLEKLKKISKTHVDLVLTIDPVKEAQHAISEVIPQLAHRYTEQAAGWILNVDVPNKQVAVWSRSQPKVLYKTSNVKRWINFYQQVDTKGLKGSVKFGIKGSPIYRADENYYLKTGLGASAHSEIGYHSSLKDTIEDEILDL